MIDWRTLPDNDEISEERFRAAKEALSGKNVVVADDNGSILKWLTYSFEDYGMNTSTFKHGQEAINYLIEKKGEIDVLIVDIIMNDLGGVEIVKKNKELAKPAFPIFITGCSPDKPQFITAKNLGVVICKPVGINRIIREIIIGIGQS